MASQPILLQKVWAGNFALGGQLNSLDLDNSVEPVDDTVLSDVVSKFRPGRFNPSMSLSGFWDPDQGDGSIDDEIFTALQTVVPVTVGVQAGADGEAAYLSKMLVSGRQVGGSHGQAASLTIAGVGGDDFPWCRGKLLHQAQITTTTSGTARQLGALTATQRLVVSLHVINPTGTAPTFDVTIESDDNSAMTTPVTRLTFTQETDITAGYQFLTVAGPITDDWWRVVATLAGGSPDATIVVAASIISY